QFRHEYFDGVIVAMAGGSHEHNALSARLSGLLMMRSRDVCRVYSSDQRYWISASTRARYSDVSIICGRPDSPPHDRQAATNPVVVFEVLSPSSEGDDDGDKRRDFQSLASLRAYVLVHQDQRLLKVYRRTDNGEWLPEPQTLRDGERVELPTLVD